jgi:glucose 1-dehydrogenase
MLTEQDKSYPLAGQAALVTGANSGIGRAIALALAGAGADIAINYYANRSAAEELAHEATKIGRKAIAIYGDVGIEEDVSLMFKQSVAEFSTLHIVVNNAGIEINGQLSSTSLQQWNDVLRVNLTGNFLCTREAIREFQRRGMQSVSRSLGKIISITSVHQEVPWMAHAPYAASKAGAMMLLKSVAREVAHQKIRVNGIAPGAVRTDMNKLAWETPAAEDRLSQIIPYSRIGEPAEIGTAACWLASDATDYMTGAVIVVDGGLSLRRGCDDAP